ncbi:MAG: hypothetical protein Q7S28_02460, partial [bacterium]|nr:hypothetical protein [bacterium]
LGHRNNNKGNSAFRGAAGVAGAAYGLHKLGEHSHNLKDIENIRSILEGTIRQLIEGEKIFCSDYELGYKEFSDHLQRLSHNVKLQRILVLR